MRVLMSASKPSETGNPYIRLLVDATRAEADVLYFSWRSALLGNYDVFHVHWPEHLLRGKSHARSALKRVLFTCMLVVLRVRRIPIVRTLHNSQPHEGASAVEASLLSALDSMTNHYIRLSAGGHAQSATTSIVPHGHYRDSYAWDPNSRPEPMSFLFFGSIRPYKRVVELCDVFRSVDVPGATLRIVGNPMNSALASAVSNAVSEDNRMSADLRSVSAAELTIAIDRAVLVVLPFRDLENSGSALLALSLNRPILIPSGPSGAELRSEVGGEWVYLFDAPLDDRQLSAAMLAVSETPPPGVVRFEGRDWPEIGRRHVQIYASVMGRASLL